MQIDATFSDSIWKMPTIDFTVTTNEMKTHLVAQCVCRQEDGETYLWACQQVIKTIDALNVSEITKIGSSSYMTYWAKDVTNHLW